MGTEVWCVVTGLIFTHLNSMLNKLEHVYRGEQGETSEVAGNM